MPASRQLVPVIFDENLLKNIPCLGKNGTSPIKLAKINKRK